MALSCVCSPFATGAAVVLLNSDTTPCLKVPKSSLLLFWNVILLIFFAFSLCLYHSVLLLFPSLNLFAHPMVCPEKPHEAVEAIKAIDEPDLIQNMEAVNAVNEFLERSVDTVKKSSSPEKWSKPRWDKGDA